MSRPSWEMNILIFVLKIWFLQLSSFSSHAQQIDGADYFVDGDIIIGGVFPFKSLEDGKCVNLKTERGIHRYEAMLYAMDLINHSKDILPNLSLGAAIWDSCNDANIALNKSLNYILGTNPTTGDQKRSAESKRLVGVIGGMASSVSVQIASLLNYFRIPQVSPASTYDELSDRTRFSYFFRTVPPDSLQSRAIAETLKKLNLTSIYTINSAGSYGENGIRRLSEAAKESSICVRESFHITNKQHVRELMEGVLSKFSQEKFPVPVVLFCKNEDTRRILGAVKELNANGKFQFFASDSWGTKLDPVDGLEDVANGSITVSMAYKEVPGFLKYLSNVSENLLIHNRTRDPWFVEYLETKFKCSFTKRGDVPPCTGNKRYVVHRHDDKVSHVINAVFSIARALHKVYLQSCPRMKGMCENLRNKLITKNISDFLIGNEIRDALYNETFNGIGGEEFRFNNNGDASGSGYTFNMFDARSRSYKTLYHWNISIESKLDDKQRVKKAESSFRKNIPFQNRGQNNVESHNCQKCSPKRRDQKGARICDHGRLALYITWVAVINVAAVVVLVLLAVTCWNKKIKEIEKRYKHHSNSSFGLSRLTTDCEESFENSALEDNSEGLEGITSGRISTEFKALPGPLQTSNQVELSSQSSASTSSSLTLSPLPRPPGSSLSLALSQEAYRRKSTDERITLQEFQRRVQYLATIVDSEEVGSFPVVFICRTDDNCSELCANQPGSENETASENTNKYSTNTETTKRKRKVLVKLLSISSNTSGDEMGVI